MRITDSAVENNNGWGKLVGSNHLLIRIAVVFLYQLGRPRDQGHVAYLRQLPLGSDYTPLRQTCFAKSHMKPRDPSTGSYLNGEVSSYLWGDSSRLPGRRSLEISEVSVPRRNRFISVVGC